MSSKVASRAYPLSDEVILPFPLRLSGKAEQMKVGL